MNGQQINKITKIVLKTAYAYKHVKDNLSQGTLETRAIREFWGCSLEEETVFNHLNALVSGAVGAIVKIVENNSLKINE